MGQEIVHRVDTLTSEETCLQVEGQGLNHRVKINVIGGRNSKENEAKNVTEIS